MDLPFSPGRSNQLETRLIKFPKISGYRLQVATRLFLTDGLVLKQERLDLLRDKCKPWISIESAAVQIIIILGSSSSLNFVIF